MIKLKFIVDVLEQSLSYDGFSPFDNIIRSWKSAKPQIEFLTDIEYNYTGPGLFIRFSHSEEALKYKSPFEDGPLGGLVIQSPDLKYGADTLLWFTDGIIDCLEIWSRSGDYPKKDLDNYSLHDCTVKYYK